MTIAIFKRPDGIKRIAAAVLAAATLISVGGMRFRQQRIRIQGKPEHHEGQNHHNHRRRVRRTIRRHGRQGHRATAQR